MLHGLLFRDVYLRVIHVSSSRHFTSTTIRSTSQSVQRLETWGLEDFRQHAFEPQVPVQLPRQTETSIAAQDDWFNLIPMWNDRNATPKFSLDQGFWSQYQDILVPLELTTNSGSSITFQQTQAPLRLFLQWVDQATPDAAHRLYLAQCRLVDLPQSLRDNVPAPEIVQKAGKGDIYDANLWMGLAPTYTPLHRDPNPNLFLQLAGRKVVTLFPPDVGASVFAGVQEKLGRNASCTFRGKEMMQGAERELLEREVWRKDYNDENKFQAVLDHGEALFIPLGWWHSIKGVGDGVTASVNWWFR